MDSCARIQKSGQNGLKSRQYRAKWLSKHIVFWFYSVHLSRTFKKFLPDVIILGNKLILQISQFLMQFHIEKHNTIYFKIRAVMRYSGSPKHIYISSIYLPPFFIKLKPPKVIP